MVKPYHFAFSEIIGNHNKSDAKAIKGYDDNISNTGAGQ